MLLSLMVEPIEPHWRQTCPLDGVILSTKSSRSAREDNEMTLHLAPQR
jgi:hypothetical protein